MLTGLGPAQAWPGLGRIVAVTGECRIGDTATRDTRYDLTRLPADTVRIGAAVRTALGDGERAARGARRGVARG